MGVTIEGGIAAIVTRDFTAPPDRLYRAFTDPDDAAAWWWGAGAVNPSADIDLRVGGRFRVGKDAPEHDDFGWGTERWYISGVFVEIDPPRRLVYTLHWEGPVGYNQTGEVVLDEAAIISFEPIEGGTRVTYEHVGIPDDGVSAVEHGKAIDATFKDLAALVEQ